jgi:hypothetical protein
MTPNVDAFVMDHEKTLNNLERSIKVNSVSMRDMLIVFHVGRRLIIMSNN